MYTHNIIYRYGLLYNICMCVCERVVCVCECAHELFTQNNYYSYFYYTTTGVRTRAGERTRTSIVQVNKYIHIYIFILL
jgi:hypothetical protein